MESMSTEHVDDVTESRTYSKDTTESREDVSSNAEENRLPEFMQLLLEVGSGIEGDSEGKIQQPNWFDSDKFARGQRFAVKYSFGIMFSQMLSLFLLFALEGGLGSLIFTRQSNTPFKAFKRYLSTGLRVKSWQEEDIWDQSNASHQSLQAVRKMHEIVRRKMKTSPPDEVAKRVTLDNGSSPMWTDLLAEVREDFRTSLPALSVRLVGRIKVYINQAEMAVTQFGFVGLLVTFPKMFGIHDASDADLDAFCHVWRTLGHCLGLEDRFNLCDGDLKTTQQRCRDHLTISVPYLRHVDRDWIHMSRCMIEGLSYFVPGISFEMALLYLCRVLRINAPNLYASMSVVQKMSYYFTVIVYSLLLRIPGLQSYFNWFIGVCIKRAQNMTQEELHLLESKIYSHAS